MDAIDALISRRSAIRLVDPAPSGQALEQILTAAARAPDHGKLRPWRFILIRGDDRKRLGAVFADAMLEQDPDAPEPLVEKRRQAPLRAPLIVTVAAKVDHTHPKIPAIEQIVAAGCAAQNIMVAAGALGFGCMWKTGAPAYDPAVKQALGLAETDEIVGFLYLGTEPTEPPQVRRPEAAEFATEWTAQAAGS
ncbi:MAG: NAD(P)H nitroreductase [Inquilinus sp.]|nr:NAD(P)H nitroreductase [Inquilinus sp.]